MKDVRWIRVFFRRFRARLVNAFRFGEMWNWGYESCDRCGSCYKLPIGWIDEWWTEINGRYEGCLCPECVVTMAQQEKIKIGKGFLFGNILKYLKSNWF